MEQREDEAPLERGPDGDDLETEDGAHPDPAGTVDALERKVLGAHPEDLRDVHDETEPNGAPAHDQDLDTEDLAGVEGRSAPPPEPPA